jgi:hypothetical protein
MLPAYLGHQPEIVEHVQKNNPIKKKISICAVCDSCNFSVMYIINTNLQQDDFLEF